MVGKCYIGLIISHFRVPGHSRGRSNALVTGKRSLFTWRPVGEYVTESLCNTELQFGNLFHWNSEHSHLFNKYLLPIMCQAMLQAQEELYKKDLHGPDNHDGVITHLEPDILECEVKWALESITMNKASGGDGIPVELFQILGDDAVKVLHSK